MHLSAGLTRDLTDCLTKLPKNERVTSQRLNGSLYEIAENEKVTQKLSFKEKGEIEAES